MKETETMTFAEEKLVPEFCYILMKTKRHKLQNESQRTFFKNIDFYVGKISMYKTMELSYDPYHSSFPYCLTII